MHDTQLLAISAVRGACPHDCPDTCAWQVIVKNGVAVKLQAIIGSAGPTAILPYSNLGTQGLIQGFLLWED
jgi:hypothetical protein